MNIDATNLHFADLNAAVRDTSDKEIVIENCIGQRYIGAGLSEKHHAND